MEMQGGVVVLDHPLVRDKVARVRSTNTGTGEFRRLVRELSLILAYEATRGLPEDPCVVKTPLESTPATRVVADIALVVPILRAGLGLAAAFEELVPGVATGHIGIARDEDTLLPAEYYCKMPSRIEDRWVFVVDPMLATGGTAAAAVARLKKAGAVRLSFVCLVAAPEGVEALAAVHPDVRIYTAALDRGLNSQGYILPGLGDAGDRLFGTT